MELWYSEFHTGNVKLSVRINRQLFSGESEFQRIDVFESEEFGRFVALDGEIVFSDKDEFIYDEMVTHVPMTVHPNVKNVLIIGGGDGGVARELIHYPQIESSRFRITSTSGQIICQKMCICHSHLMPTQCNIHKSIA